MKRHSYFIVLAAAWMVLGGWGCRGTYTNPISPVSASRGRVAFTSARDGYDATYIMNPDGSGQIRLTDDTVTGDSDNPVLSPDGRKIVFSSQLLGICLMNSDGSSIVPVVPVSSGNNIFRWSHDSTHVAYANHEGGFYVFKSDGTGGVSMTSTDGSAQQAWDMDWSPDGLKFVYNSPVSGQMQVFTVNEDGSGPVTLTQVGDWYHPRWSPTGAYIACIDGTASYVLRMGQDGSNPMTLASDPYTLVPPEWSPDGKQLAYVDGGSLMVANPDGGNLRNLAPEGGISYEIAWSPDSMSLVYVVASGSGAAYFNSHEIHFINTDGTGHRQLTKNSFFDAYPSWQ